MAGDTDPSQFQQTPQGWADYWRTELEAAEKALATSRMEGRIANEWFLNKKDADTAPSRFALYTMTVGVQKAVLYGQTPKALATRKYADADDDTARVAGVMLGRLLNDDIERDSDSYAKALDSCLDDMLVPGICQARLRYVAAIQKETVPPLDAQGNAIPGNAEGAEGEPPQPVAAEGYEAENVTQEDVEIDWVPWDDYLYSPCRNASLKRWEAYRMLMAKEAVGQKFGKPMVDLIPFAVNVPKDADKESKDPWARAEVWEIWSKEHKKVFFYAKGCDRVLAPIGIQGVSPDGSVGDPLRLEGFFAAPEAIVENTTNGAYVPRPDFAFAQDQYRQLNLIVSKETQLIDALKVGGLYNEEMGEVVKELVQASPNRMIPVKDWKVFAEKGGIENNVAWFPLQVVVGTLDKLREKKQETIDDIFMLTGIGDILHGQSTESNVTATEQSIKAKFGSVRMRKRQLRFAKFATDILRLKAEIISKHFSIQTIIERSNIMNTADAATLTPDGQPMPQAAAELIKSKFACYRIEVKPEAISLADAASQKQQRGEFMQSLAQFMVASQPIAAASPAATPFLLRIAQWALAPLEGASTIEGEFDRMIAAAEKTAQQASMAPPQARQDPASALKLQTQMLKGQQDQEKIKAELEADGVRAQMEVAADKQREWDQAEANNWERQRQNDMQTTRETQRALLKPKPMPNGGT